MEWVTSRENKLHAKINNLTNYASCENHGKAKYKNSQIKNACKLLSKNKNTIDEISHMSGVDTSTLYNIRSKGVYKNISSKFIFPKETIRPNLKYDDNTIKKICKLKVRGYNVKEISYLTGVKISTVNDVIKRRRRYSISKNYTFDS